MVPLAAWPSPDGNASKSSGRACASPGGEGARKSKIHPGAIPGNLVRNDSGGEEVLAEKWGGLFWVTSLEKIFGGVIAIILFRQEDGCSSLPCRGVLSFRSEGREASGSETARVHHAARGRGYSIAARQGRGRGLGGGLRSIRQSATTNPRTNT